MKEKIKILTDGKPDIKALPISEQRVFYTTLLARILELYRKQKENDYAYTQSKNIL